MSLFKELVGLLRESGLTNGDICRMMLESLDQTNINIDMSLIECSDNASNQRNFPKNYFEEIVNALYKSEFTNIEICRMMLESLGEPNINIDKALMECSFSKGYLSTYQIKFLEQNESLIQIKKSVLQQIKVDKKENFRKNDVNKIKELLGEFGISKNLLGYKYLQDAVEEYYLKVRKNEVFRITAIYQIVAEINDSTVSRVERAIRHAISVAFQNNEAGIRERFFNQYLDKIPSSNALTIATLADNID